MRWTMKLCIVLLVGLLGSCAGLCPSLCTCKNGKAEGSVSDPSPGDLLRLKCGGAPNPITELKEIDLTRIWSVVGTLNLSGNAITILSRELYLPNLQKLDLSHNQINLIESDAFYNMTSLQRLDLSNNEITSVYKEMFKGLVNLERLVLAQNHISTLVVGTFDYLVGLTHLDLAGNPLICDCDLLWLGEWAQNTSVKLGSLKCASPENLSNKPVRKLKNLLDLSSCSNSFVRPSLSSTSLIVKPMNDQVVFEGDALTLTCNAPFASVQVKYELKWHSPVLETSEVNITNTDLQEEGFAETTVSFVNITNHHMGNWSCSYNDQNHIQHSHTVEVIVISNQTKYCPTRVTENNKGLFSWPLLLVNHTVSVPCRSGDGKAYRSCTAEGNWGPVNTTECGYISNVTKLLQQFALLNLSLVQYSAVNATERLAMLIQEKTYPFVEISDPDDVLFIADAVENYMQYIAEEKDLGSALLDVISACLNISRAVLVAAETEYRACTRLMRAAETAAAYTGNVQGHKVNLAVEMFPVRDGFTGATCVWHSGAALGGAGGGAPRLHCTTTNRTVAPLLHVSDAIIHASVQIPQSLLYSITESTVVPTIPHELVVAMYADAALFPLLPERDNAGTTRAHRAKDYYGRSTKREDLNMEITSPVVGFQLSNMSGTGELLEPIIVTVRAGAVGGVDGRAAVWDPLTRRWEDNTTDCKISHVIADMIIMSCTKLAYVGLLQNVETGIFGTRTDGARFKASHPAIYVGSLILIGCLICTSLTYIMCFSSIQMPKKSKHALVNTWIAMALLCFMYMLGIYQTEDVKLCQILGLLIHYLTLCCLLWHCVSASTMYKFVTKTRTLLNPVRSIDDDAPPEVPVQKPILGLYLIGWGIALIICGISGAVNLKDYAGYSQCFISSLPALSALFVPAGILLTMLIFIFCATRLTIRFGNIQLSEGTQATENVDLEMWEPNQVSDNPDRRSIKSAVDSEIEDTEHSTVTQCNALAIGLILFLFVWICGAITVYRPLPEYLPYQEDICSILFAVCATICGTFNLFFYGISRSDVRAQWALMHCYLRKSKQCCRNRQTVFDSNQPNLPTNQSMAPLNNPIPNDNRSRSGSRSSNRTNSKTNNSATYKAGAELNGLTLQKDPSKNINGKAPNINLVVLHRQQYRSDNSMMTYPDPTNIGPEMFYNPNQMNVAKKFFKKQRQNMKRNCLELPTRRDCDTDSHVSLPLPTREAYSGVANIINSGSKVNNTNIHVDRSNNGMKESRNTLDPNLLQDDNDYNKKYNTDPKRWSKNDNKPSRVMNIYTNVPETQIPQHQVVKPLPKNFNAHRTSNSEECLQSHADQPEMRTISQQCSLEYSSASEMAMPHTCSDQTLNTHSEMTSCQESALCSTNEITDTESFGQYIDYLQPKQEKDGVDKSLQDISEECTMNSDEINIENSHNIEEAGEMDNLLENADNEGSKEKIDDKDEFFMAKNTYDFETCSTNASDHNFENESDIYCPNYQMSEVSIRSHGLYAPSPSSMCPNEISFSNEDVSNIESQYVNYDPGWRKTIKNNPKLGKYVPTPAISCPEVNRDSPNSYGSDIDELYTQITRADKDRTKRKDGVLDVTVNSDVTLKPTDSDSCVSEAVSDVEVKAETTV